MNDHSRGAAPTDLDLMLYADGELEPERLALVESWLARDAAARSKLAALDLVSGMVRERATQSAQRVPAGITDAVMARIDAEAKAVPVVAPTTKAPRSAANDNARGLYLVAAFVVAAAAVVMLWRSPIRAGHAVARGVVEDEMAATIPADPQKHEADVEHGVEVSSIDFGSANGAVLYVPNGPSSTTTVVWLADDEDDAAGDEP